MHLSHRIATPLVNLMVLAAVALATLVVPAPAGATSYVMMDDADLLAQAGAVVDARVTAVEPAPVAGRPSTDYTIEIERLLAGSAPGTTLIVRVLGGERPDGIGFKVYGAPKFSVGDRALLFLSPRQDGTFGILQLMLGAFRRVQLPAGPPLAVRNLSEATEVVLPGQQTDPRRHLPRDYDAFASWIADRAAGVDRPEDYFVTDPTIGKLLGKYTLFEDGNGTNLRWFVFDSGGQVPWYLAQGGQTGIADGGLAAFKRALNAWNQDSATPIRLVYAGRTGAVGGLTTYDGLNVLLPGDPNQEISGTFQCGSGGTLAIGGPWFNNGAPETFRGLKFVRIVGGDVVMNDGIECMKPRTGCFEANIEEIYGHELGHTLGLGHSCGDSSSPSCLTNPSLEDALMNAFAHGDCRGAAVKADDLAGARFLYRLAGGGSSPGPKAPADLAGQLDEDSVTLTWDDRSTDEDGFRIYRAAGSGAFSQVGTASPDLETFIDETIRPATTYRYKVGAYNGKGERQSSTVTVNVPPIVPLSVALVEHPNLEIHVGEPVELEALFTGDARSAEWSFGGDAVGYNDTPCSASSFCRSQIFTTPGQHEVTVSLDGPFGQVVTDQMSVRVLDAPFDPAVDETFLQWTLFGARGNTGTFESNVWLYNAGTGTALVELTFLPRGNRPASEPRTLTIDPQESVFLPNVLQKVFGISSDQGSIGLRTMVPDGSQPKVVVISRAFVNLPNPAEGSFGQFIGGQPAADWTAGEKVVTGVLDGEGFIATLLAANVDDHSGRVEVSLTDRDGQAVGEPAALGLGAKSMRFQPLTSLFPDAADRQGPFTARFTSNGIRFVGSSTLLEVGSEDQIFIPAEAPVESSEIILPRVVRSPGQFGVFLTTAVTVLNNATVPTQLTFQFLQRGQDNSDPIRAIRTVPAGGVLYLEDVVSDLFDLDTGTGALEVTWSNGEDVAPRIVGTTLSENPRGDRFGMLVDSRTPDAAVTAHGIDFGIEQSSVFHSQYGVVSLLNGRTDIRLTLRDGNGKVLGEATRALKPRQHLELNVATLFDVAVAGQNWSITTEVLSGGPVMTYLANINTSGDVFLVPGHAID